MAGTDELGALPASWYPDPDDIAQLRWWNGSAWTDHVEQLPPPPSSRNVVPAIETERDAFIIKTEVPETGTWNAETGNHYIPRLSRTDLPAAERDANDDFNKVADVGSRWTVETWVLAFLPLIAVGLQYFVTSLGAGSIVLNSPILFWLVPVLFVIANPVMAAMDRTALAARNVPGAPSAALGILPPVYLLARTFTVGPSSLLPFLIWCGSAVAVFEPLRRLIAGFLATTSALG